MAEQSDLFRDRSEEEEEVTRSSTPTGEDRPNVWTDRLSRLEERQIEAEGRQREAEDRQFSLMNRMMDRLEEIERNGRGGTAIRTTHTQPRELGSSGLDGSPPSEVYVRPTSSVEEPERRWAASPFCPSVAPREVQAREGARAVEFPTPTIDDQDRDNDFYGAPNENRFLERDFIVNDANVENMVETNTRDDLYDDLLRNDANGRLVVAQRRGQNELYQLNDERMQLQLQYTQDGDHLRIHNESFQIIDHWPPQTHHYMPRDHSQYDPTQNATEMVNVQTRQISEPRGMPEMHNGYTEPTSCETRLRSTNERVTETVTQNAMQRSNLDLFYVSPQPYQQRQPPEQGITVGRSEEFLLSRSYAPTTSILSSQGRPINKPQYSTPMRHLSNA